MRNIGASIGIASVTTISSRHAQIHTNTLGANVTPYNPLAQSMMAQMKGAFMARGMDAATATKQAAAGLFGMVQQQAAMMGYVDVFFLLAIMFAACLPLILIMKKAPKGGGVPRGDGPLGFRSCSVPLRALCGKGFFFSIGDDARCRRFRQSPAPLSH